MPELPEVEICGRNLARWSAGRTVVAVRLPDPAAVRSHLTTSGKHAHEDGAGWLARHLVGSRPGEVVRRGKRLGWRFGEAGLLLHLGMTGRWIRRASSEEPPAHARLGLELDDGHTLWFQDTRRFGCVVPVTGDVAAAVAGGLGPDALDGGVDGAELAARMGRGGMIKTRLMDQHRLAGVGNIQAAEALFRAAISPEARPETLRAEDWERLAQALHAQLAYTIEVTNADEVAYMTDGAHVDNPFAVYGREGEACGRCGATIVKARHGGRATFWCPGCQVDPRNP